MDKERKFFQALLKEYYDTKRKINFLNDKILNYEKMKNNMEELPEEVLKCEKQLIEEYKNKIKEYVFINTILELDFPDVKKILDDRYLRNKSWQSVAMNNYISLRHCYNIENKVIKGIKKEYLKFNAIQEM